MKAKSPLSVRLLYWFATIGFYLMISIQILVIVLFVGRAAGVVPINDLQLRVQLPMKFDVEEQGAVHYGGNVHLVYLEEASSKIYFVDTPDFVSNFGIVSMLVAITLFVVMLHKFRAILGNVRVKQVFVHANIKHLKTLAYLLVAFWLFTVGYMYFAFYWIHDKVGFETVQMTNNLGLNGYSWMLFTELVIWILAQIFGYGVQLKEESDLTI